MGLQGWEPKVDGSRHCDCDKILPNNINKHSITDNSVAFSQNAYQQKYLAHIKRLKDFDERTKESGIVPRLRKHLLKMAR